MLLGFNGATTLTADLATDIRAEKAAGYGCLEILGVEDSRILR